MPAFPGTTWPTLIFALLWIIWHLQFPLSLRCSLPERVTLRTRRTMKKPGMMSALERWFLPFNHTALPQERSRIGKQNTSGSKSRCNPRGSWPAAWDENSHRSSPVRVGFLKCTSLMPSELSGLVRLKHLWVLTPDLLFHSLTEREWDEREGWG